jgi:hypothetical protein
MSIRPDHLTMERSPARPSAIGARPFDTGLSDQWRYSLSDVRECLMFIRQHVETIDRRNERLSSGQLVNRRSYVTQARRQLALRLRMYLAAVRRVSEAEAAMTRIGMAFAVSSDAWAEVA